MPRAKRADLLSGTSAFFILTALIAIPVVGVMEYMKYASMEDAVVSYVDFGIPMVETVAVILLILAIKTVWDKVFRVDEESAALDIIKQVSHGNTFLTHPHTARNFRSELFFRDRWKLRWEATLSDRMLPESREVVKKILAEHRVPELDHDIARQGDGLIRERIASALPARAPAIRSRPMKDG